MFGGIVSGFIGISSVFIVTGVLFVLAFGFLRYTLAKPEQDFEDVLLEQELKNM